MPRLASSTLALLLTVAPGCSGLAEMTSKVNPWADHVVRADEKNPAVEVACIWQPGEGRNDKGIPSRGFSGQVFFFTGRDSEPALVNGTMRVYLFADRGTHEERAKPLHQYDFTPEAWSAHATMTSLGPGYTVFVPFPGTEPYQVRCQLRARFTAQNGQAIWSEAVAMTLEGPPRPGQEPLSMAGKGPNAASLPTIIDAKLTHRRASADELTAEGSEAEPRRLRTDTFRIGEIQQTAFNGSPRKAATAGGVPVDELDAGTLRQMLKDKGKAKHAAAHPLETAERQHSSPGSHPLADSPAELLEWLDVPQEGAEPTQAAAPAPPALRATLTGRDSPLTRRHPLSEDAASDSSATIRRSDARPVIAHGQTGWPKGTFTPPPFAANTADYGRWTSQAD